jgi:hypothetical protein
MIYGLPNSGELYYFGKMKIKIWTPNTVSEDGDDFILESPNGVNTFRWSIERIQSSKYRDGNGDMQLGYFECQLKMQYDYSTHNMELNKLLVANKIRIPIRPSFDLLTKLDFILDNDSVERNWMNGMVTARNNIEDSFFPDEDEGWFSKQEYELDRANEIPQGSVSLLFLLKKRLTKQEVLALKWLNDYIELTPMFDDGTPVSGWNLTDVNNEEGTFTISNTLGLQYTEDTEEELVLECGCETFTIPLSQIEIS